MSRARIGEARGDADAVIAALEPVRAFAYRDACDEPGFWPWQDLYADALVGTGRVEEADAFLRPHEELAAERGRRIGDRPAGPIPRPDRGRGRSTGGGRGSVRPRPRTAATDCTCPSNGPGSNWPRARSCAGPGAGVGRRTC